MSLLSFACRKSTSLKFKLWRILVLWSVWNLDLGIKLPQFRINWAVILAVVFPEFLFISCAVFGKNMSSISPTAPTVSPESYQIVILLVLTTFHAKISEYIYKFWPQRQIVLLCIEILFYFSYLIPPKVIRRSIIEQIRIQMQSIFFKSWTVNLVIDEEHNHQPSTSYIKNICSPMILTTKSPNKNYIKTASLAFVTPTIESRKSHNKSIAQS